LFICFLDNDILLKLTAFDVFEEAIATLDLNWQNLRILNTAIHIFKGKKVAAQYSEAVRQKAIDIVQTCKAIPTEDSDEFSLLQKIDNIDPGEATLIAATARESEFWLITGDKCCLNALSEDPRLELVARRLFGRIICLEQLIEKLISTHGFDWVQQRIFPARSCDRTIKIIFGWSEPADATSVCEGLQSYICDLQQRSPNLLADLTQLNP
jgi:hypothetical protein